MPWVSMLFNDQLTASTFSQSDYIRRCNREHSFYPPNLFVREPIPAQFKQGKVQLITTSGNSSEDESARHCFCSGNNWCFSRKITAAALRN